jgi:hypothetical protein
MLARLAATLRGRQGGVGGMEGLGAAHDGDTPVVLDDNCSVSTTPGSMYDVNANICRLCELYPHLQEMAQLVSCFDSNNSASTSFSCLYFVFQE